MSKNYLLIYFEQLATEIELLCQNIKAPSNTLFQIRKSSSSIYANIREANYGQSKSDMISKFEIVLKECSETEGWLNLLFKTKAIALGKYSVLFNTPPHLLKISHHSGDLPEILNITILTHIMRDFTLFILIIFGKNISFFVTSPART